MTNFYHCRDCHVLNPIEAGDSIMCADCGSYNLELDIVDDE